MNQSCSLFRNDSTQPELPILIRNPMGYCHIYFAGIYGSKPMGAGVCRSAQLDAENMRQSKIASEAATAN